LLKETVLQIVLPRLTSRKVFEELQSLSPRKSTLAAALGFYSNSNNKEKVIRNKPKKWNKILMVIMLVTTISILSPAPPHQSMKITLAKNPNQTAIFPQLLEITQDKKNSSPL
jgi:hypothetical protein